jgi:penicillin-binding protein activator
VVQRFIRPVRITAASIAVAAALAGCGGVDNTRGRPSVYEDVGSTGRVQGVGAESQDIVSMTDQMMRDMLAEPRLAGRKIAPNIIVDDEYFSNDSTWRADKKLITDRLRVNLNRAAQGRMVFIARHVSAMVDKERDLKRAGAVDSGTLSQVQLTKGADFRLSGHITSLDSLDPASGTKSRYTQVTFEMVDLETGAIAWSNLYEMKKSAQDDIIYR